MKTKIGLALGAILLASAALAAEQAAAGAYKTINLVSNKTGVAKNVDPNLVNAWGLAQAPGGPAWVADQGTNLSTVYNRVTGKPNALVVNIPLGGPTGIVYAPASLGFVVSENGKSGPATFIFDTTSGAIEGWASNVDQTNAIVAVNNSSSGASYTGLAVDGPTKLLFAANNAQNKVEVYNNQFQLVNTFTDPNLPQGYSPYNIIDVNGTLYVAFANGFGVGLGYVDVFNTGGVLQKQLIAKGKLNAPWGMAIAPSAFGSFANDLLVGNLGDGRIHAYDPNSGAMLGTLTNSKGKPLTISLLWALDAGPNTNQVNFSAGPNGYADGLFGLIQPAK